MTGQRSAGTPHGTTPTHHTDAPHTRLWLAAVALGSVATTFLILGAIPWACGAWT